MATRAPSGPTEPGTVDLMEVAQEAARAAGDLILAGRRERVEVHATKTSPQDVVTAMDLAAEDLLRQMLSARRPHDGILGEEHGFTPGTSGITWVLDPIDGTVNYLYGLPGYAVLVAAVVDEGVPDPATWTVLASCVHAPQLGRTWTAARGVGAWRDGEQLQVEASESLAQSLLGTGFGYREEVRADQGRVIAQLLPAVRDIRRQGSAGLDLCLVADGSLDLYFERGLNPWDLAAGQLVAAEAGAVVTGLRGSPAGSAMTVAGHQDRIGQLVTILEDLDADRPL
jgi:myo-inositol-1(or 4)-monophosphatase